MGLINVHKLHKELKAQVPKIVGVDGTGKVSWSTKEEPPTDEELSLVKSIIEKHDPTPEEEIDLLEKLTELESLVDSLLTNK